MQHTLKYLSRKSVDWIKLDATSIGRPLYERFGFELRTEFFNIFNRTQFAPPNTICCTANNQNFGVVTSTAPGTNPRLVQFGLKFLF